MLVELVLLYASYEAEVCGGEDNLDQQKGCRCKLPGFSLGLRQLYAPSCIPTQYKVNICCS